MDEYFCPNCGATLNYQDGFDPSIGAWTCTECGQLLMDDDVYDGDTFEGVAWYCDDCGALLNKQYGFSDSYGTWTCTECGHTNGINEDEIIDGKHFTCPECGATLNNQFGFNAYDDDWECSSCGAKLTHSYSDDDYSVVEEDKICCPNCDANLEDQWGYSEYNYDWTCTECGAHLHREYTSDEFEQVEETEEDDERNYTCPMCDSDLADQYGYDEEYDDWKCECCGTKLHRYFGDHEYSIVDESDDDHTDTSETKEPHTYSSEQFTYRDAFDREEKSVLLKEKSELRKIRMKAFFTSRKKVPIGYSTQQLVGKNYREVENRLYNQAFKNIHLKSQKDIYVNSIFKDGEVESVLINGTTVFSQQEMYPYDSEVVITYHEKREITISFTHGNLRKLNYMDVHKKLSNLGFINISVQPINDLTTGWIKKDGSVERVRINSNTNYRKGAVFKYDVPIVIEYHTFKNRH